MLFVGILGNWPSEFSFPVEQLIQKSHCGQKELLFIVIGFQQQFLLSSSCLNVLPFGKAGAPIQAPGLFFLFAFLKYMLT